MEHTTVLPFPSMTGLYVTSLMTNIQEFLGMAPNHTGPRAPSRTLAMSAWAALMMDATCVGGPRNCNAKKLSWVCHAGGGSVPSCLGLLSATFRRRLGGSSPDVQHGGIQALKRKSYEARRRHPAMPHQQPNSTQY